MASIFKNKKTGKLYVSLGAGVDCTNSRDGLPVVVYRALDAGTELFVREANEFAIKFDAVDPDDSMSGQILRAQAEVATWPESVRLSLID